MPRWLLIADIVLALIAVQSFRMIITLPNGPTANVSAFALVICGVLAIGLNLFALKPELVRALRNAKRFVGSRLHRVE